jgi:hypothetical protein
MQYKNTGKEQLQGAKLKSTRHKNLKAALEKAKRDVHLE